MAIDYKVWNFPTFPISKQLFHVPGAAADGGFTSGGARITSPEPGGFSVLEIQPSFQTGEWEYPLSSWLMSKSNGQILRVRLAPTPQVASQRSLVPAGGVPWGAEGGYPESPWSNQQNWSGDLAAMYFAPALEGTGIVKVDMSSIGPILRPGHVLGNGDATHLIDEIEYNANGIATIALTPPLRRNISIGDPVYFRPYFTGSIANPGDFRNSYDAENVGNIQLNKIILNEVILP
jgi:hypothetical protein